MSKHTPGPWKIEKNGSISAPNNWVLATIDHYPNPSVDTRANAALIAAAPELLEALRGVLAIADRKTKEFDAARAAIAKAEGASS